MTCSTTCHLLEAMSQDSCRTIIVLRHVHGILQPKVAMLSQLLQAA